MGEKEAGVSAWWNAGSLFRLPHTGYTRTHPSDSEPGVGVLLLCPDTTVMGDLHRAPRPSPEISVTVEDCRWPLPLLQLPRLREAVGGWGRSPGTGPRLPHTGSHSDRDGGGTQHLPAAAL